MCWFLPLAQGSVSRENVGSGWVGERQEAGQGKEGKRMKDEPQRKRRKGVK